MKYTAVLVFLVVLSISALTTQPLTRPANAGGSVSAPEGKSTIAPLHQRASLPPLLQMLDGTSVDRSNWPKRREEIRQLMCEYFIGTFPESPPKVLEAKMLEQKQPADGSTRRQVRLTFDTPNRASFTMRVWIPPGDGPFPVLLTMPYYQDWASVGLRRGYLVALYPGSDSDDQTEAFRKAYPECTWKLISRRAWLGSRALDFVSTLPEADAGKVAITGHSRNGKQALIAAAFDERIGAVVSSSSGSPGAAPYRFTSRNTFAEAPSDFPIAWFLLSLKKYTGREHELPIDAHGWLALIAPRHCLLATAYNDGCEPTFAVERAYLAGQSVYRLLGRPNALRIQWRPGGHHRTLEEDLSTVDSYFDWFNLAFDRGTARPSDFPDELIHHFDFQSWKSREREEHLKMPFDGAKPQDDADRRARILWALGRKPDKIEWDGQYTFITPEESKRLDHDRWRVPDTARLPVSFGENVGGNIYYNPQLKQPAPAIIWLHPYSYQNGYNEGYGVQGTTVYHRLARAGYVVLCYDQCGFGLRLLEGRDFYEHYPAWSKLGRMVHDVQTAVDFLTEGRGSAEGKMPAVDKERIYVLGYSLGGMVGLYATALDERIAGVASFCGFTPLQTDTDAKPTGGIRRLWEWHSLQPLLGLFDGREQHIPYDFDDVLALIAPRPCLIYSPQRDREADFDDVVKCVGRAREAWSSADKGDNLTHQTPNDINRFQSDQQNAFLEWRRQTGD